MPSLTLKLKRLSAQATMPAYQTDGASGMDLCAACAEPVRLAPGQHALIPTGWAIALPAGHEGQVRPRSGLAVKHGVTVLNAPGTIDEDYRGEVKVALINLGREVFVVEQGMRIAQLVVTPVSQVSIIEAQALTDTDRASGGFGSTGTH